MLTVRDEYSLRRFDRRSVRTAAFDKAISIYQETTGGRAKTDASQIVYWVERSSEPFSQTGDQVHVLGLLRERVVVGFALCFYAPVEKLFLVDHIAITPSARSMTAFERFCELIARYTRDERLEVDYFVAEVSTDINDADPLLNADTLVRLLQIKGLRVVDCRYLTPSPERRPPYEPIPARLLLYSTTEGRIAAQKLLNVIACLHEGIYKNWYKAFANDFEKYCAHLRDIEETVRRDIGNKNYVAMHGHPVALADVRISDIPQKPFVVLAYIVVAAILSVAAAYAISLANIGVSSALAGAVAVAICTLAIMALWYEPAARLVKYGVDALVSAFGKRQ